MSLHTADIAARLKRFLDRRQSPKRIEGKPQAEMDEIRALVGVTERNAPHSAERLATWWPRFEAQLGENSNGLWPTEKDIRDAAAAVAKLVPMAKSEIEAPDEFSVIGERMATGQPVGEGYLYGRNAVELIRRRLVTEDVMKGYRSGAFLSRREMYGEEAALRWEAEAKDRHEAAKLILRDQTPHRGRVSIPDKTAPTKGFAA